MMNKLSAKAYGRLAPLISICDFYLWGNLKGKVYKNNPQTADALKTEIRNIVRSINGDKLQSFPKPHDNVQGLDHFQHLL
jgi:hypothetical protein